MNQKSTYMIVCFIFTTNVIIMISIILSSLSRPEYISYMNSTLQKK